MKMRWKRLDNKGAALVTILIAVTFMTIMATSLMYMAYMNYLTKSMRYSSTDNFYTDEFALDDLATSLQQVAADSSNADIDDAKTAVLTAVGATGMHDVTDGYGTRREGNYTNDDVRNLITVADQEVASVSVNCAPSVSGNNLIVGNDYIKLCGVMITVTTTEGYKNTITSDITMSFPNSIPGALDINDFSVITDSPLEFTNGGFRYFSGNIFAQNTSGGTGLLVDHNTTLGLLSPQAMIVGDVVVTGNSTLHVTGNMTVYGEVIVDSGSVLICSGTIRAEDGIGGTGTFKGISPRDGETVGRSPLLPDDGLVSSLFTDVWVNTRSGELKTFDLSIYDAGSNQTLELWRPGASQLDPSVPKCFVYTYGATINISNDPTSPDSKYHNALIMMERDATLKLATHDGVIAETTVLTTGKVEQLFEQGTLYMSKMSDEAFEEAKEYLFYRNGQIYLRDTPDGGYGHANIGSDIYFAGGSIESVGNFDSLDILTPVGTWPYEYRYDSGNNNTNYVPMGYFLVDDTSHIISEIFSAPTGAPDPKNSIIMYECWSKD